MKKYLLIAILLLVALVADAETPKVIHSVGGDVRGAYVLSSSNNLLFGNQDAETFTGLHPSEYIRSMMSVHAKYSFGYTSATRAGRLYPEAYQGMGMSVTRFSKTRPVGTPVSLYFFQGAPIKHFSPRLSMGYEWNFGISAGWHKSTMAVAPDANIFVGSRFNAYINLGFVLDYRLTDALTLRGGVEMTHFSDGNTSLPNPGVNAVGARIGVSYALGNGKDIPAAVPPLPEEVVRPHWSYDILAYGSASKKAVTIEDRRVVVPGKFGLCGLMFSPMRTVNQYFRYGGALDLKYDAGTNLQSHIREGSTPHDVMVSLAPFRKRLIAGLSARAELVMPIFSVNVGLGRNLLCVSSARKFYQIANLRIHPFRSVWLNIGYQLHNFRHPDNLVLGIGYTIR